MVIDAVTPLFSPLLAAGSSEGEARDASFAPHTSARCIHRSCCHDGVYEGTTPYCPLPTDFNSRKGCRRHRRNAKLIRYFPQITNNATLAQASKGNARASIQLKPSLGPSFTYLTDATIWLSRMSEVPTNLRGGLSVAEQQDIDEDYVVENVRSRHTVCIRRLRYNVGCF